MAAGRKSRFVAFSPAAWWSHRPLKVPCKKHLKGTKRVRVIVQNGVHFSNLQSPAQLRPERYRRWCCPFLFHLLSLSHPKCERHPPLHTSTKTRHRCRMQTEQSLIGGKNKDTLTLCVDCLHVAAPVQL